MCPLQHVAATWRFLASKLISSMAARIFVKIKDTVRSSENLMLGGA
jgi:hypothetical protein